MNVRCKTPLRGTGIAVITLLSLTVPLWFNHSAAQTPVVWRFGFMPVPGSSYQAMVDSLPERVAKATNGQIKLEPSPLSGKPEEQVASLRDGRLDIISFITPVYRAELPILTIAELPGLFRSIEEYRRVTDQLLFESFRSVLLDKYGLVYLSVGTLPGTVLFSQKRIQATADLKGVKIRVPTTGAAAYFTALGASPTSASSAEVFTALQRGVVNAALVSPVGSWEQLSRVSKYVIEWRPGYITPWAIVVGGNAFNSLTGDLRTVIEREFKGLQDQEFSAVIAETRKTLEMLTKDVTLVSLSNAQVAELAAPQLVNPIYQAWIDLNKKQGVDGELILARVQAAKGTGGGGDPCYLPTCKCRDGSCKTDCCPRKR